MQTIAFCYEKNCSPSRYNGNAAVRCLGSDSPAPLSGISSQYNNLWENFKSCYKIEFSSNSAHNIFLQSKFYYYHFIYGQFFPHLFIFYFLRVFCTCLLDPAILYLRYKLWSSLLCNIKPNQILTKILPIAVLRSCALLPLRDILTSRFRWIGTQRNWKVLERELHCWSAWCKSYKSLHLIRNPLITCRVARRHATIFIKR
jgi:hypothetical protein